MVWPEMIALTRSPDTCPDFFPAYQTVLYDDPDAIAFQSYSSTTNGTYVNPVYSSPEADALIAAGRAETDPDRRLAKYRLLQALLLEDAPSLFVLEENRKYAHRTALKGFQYSPLKLNALDLFALSLG